ncbi:type II toxin-antitoxin system HicA family toxin [Thiorhodococcus mannitoliphagus]|uniref:Type II toxin-antitoxin system HicA family toxin n=1 Tax=Thiorhodococcus mannitoliphagus TaxID=329406 RepID=A0A6P1E1B3_9GAMM|nr:type II toxin-antitoxin system HicA family toxin [Thiorhodococcus mannitoliphagus]NEX23101.1 type II toxin-antitoxin system HicA family toxin [Thiorhodococcus mannitoliphagus]
MKRNALIRHLSKYGCELVREGGRHSIWKNKNTGEMTAVPRHNEIKELMARKICRDPGIEEP